MSRKENIIAITKMIPGFLFILGIAYLILSFEEVRGFLLICLIGVVVVIVILLLMSLMCLFGEWWSEGWNHFLGIHRSSQHDKLMEELKKQEEKNKQEE